MSSCKWPSSRSLWLPAQPFSISYGANIPPDPHCQPIPHCYLPTFTTLPFSSTSHKLPAASLTNDGRRSLKHAEQAARPARKL